MNNKLQTIKYVIADYLSATIAWALFFAYRKYSYAPFDGNLKEVVLSDSKFYSGLLIIPIFWVLFYFFLGNYKAIYRKSRIRELGLTFMSSLIGVSLIFFAVILDDYVHSYKELYVFAIVLFTIHFLLTAFFRLILTTITVRKIHNGTIGFKTLIVGGNGNATSIFLDISNQYISSGNKFMGFVHVNEASDYKLAQHLHHYGHYSKMEEIIENENIEEVIIAIDPSEHTKIKSIITALQNSKVVIKVIPDMYDIMLGSVKMTAIFQAPLIQIYPDIMPYWQIVLKRVMDVSFSIIAIILLSPLYLFTAMGVYFTSKGPIFYSQERIGLNGKPFKMLKFRTMVQDAEENGPQLSSDNDPRITPFGRFMRKVRLDEIPQFFTVIKGDMSIVGYRPERQYFIDQIVKVAPHYKLLLKIKPGITSWGQVKYGYAENVEEMVERLKYDILYLENMSISVDLKILFYTFIIVLTGRGK
jgi:exopolysaccharide biosynthesis polyprenyl glycosylphosphotransferase